MKWNVAWRRSARDDLARLWLDPTLRADVTAAANRIDKILATDPLNAGESRDKERRVLIELPLGVLFTLKIAEHKVVVLRIWSIS